MPFWRGFPIQLLAGVKRWFPHSLRPIPVMDLTCIRMNCLQAQSWAHPLSKFIVVDGNQTYGRSPKHKTRRQNINKFSKIYYKRICWRCESTALQFNDLLERNFRSQSHHFFDVQKPILHSFEIYIFHLAFFRRHRFLFISPRHRARSISPLAPS